MKIGTLATVRWGWVAKVVAPFVAVTAIVVALNLFG
jgi:hypothetical protein